MKRTVLALLAPLVLWPGPFDGPKVVSMQEFVVELSLGSEHPGSVGDGRQVKIITFVEGGVPVRELEREERYWLLGVVEESLGGAGIERYEQKLRFDTNVLSESELKQLAGFLNVPVQVVEGSGGRGDMTVGSTLGAQRARVLQALVDDISETDGISEAGEGQRILLSESGEQESLRALRGLSEEVGDRLRGYKNIEVDIRDLAAQLAEDFGAPVVFLAGTYWSASAEIGAELNTVDAYTYALRQNGVALERYSDTGPFFLRSARRGRDIGRLSFGSGQNDSSQSSLSQGGQVIAHFDPVLRDDIWIIKVRAVLSELLDLEGISLLQVGNRGCVFVGREKAVGRLSDLLRACFVAASARDVRIACSAYLQEFGHDLR